MNKQTRHRTKRNIENYTSKELSMADESRNKEIEQRGTEDRKQKDGPPQNIQTKHRRTLYKLKEHRK